ncbi:MAG: nitroreductase family protein, partial [bacterium]
MELTIHEAIYSTRAMRRLKPDPVPAEDLRYIIDAATQAPTGQNQQLWSFVVLVDPEPRQRLAELYRELGRKIVKPVAEDPNVPEDRR